MRKFLSSVVAASMLASAFCALSPALAATQSGSLTLNFDDGESKFTAANRTTCTVENGEQVITSANNAGNAYGLAYYDFSSVSEGADEVVVEFDSRISSDTRYWISLYDTSLRGTTAGGSSGATYNTTGLIYTMGLGNSSNLYQVMGVNVSDSAAALDNTIHAKVTVSFVNNTMDYTVTTESGTTLSSGTGKAFKDTSAAQCTGIEFYTWTNNTPGYIDNLTVTAYKEDTDLTGSLTLDFSDGVSQLTQANRVTCSVTDGIQYINSAENAGNEYSLAYYDFSSAASGANEVIVEFDSLISSGSRYYVSLYDAAKRGTKAGGSSKSTYNTDYLIYSAGTGDGTYYRACGSTSLAAFDDMVHTKVNVDLINHKMSYTITSSSGTTLYSKSDSDFYNTSSLAQECTGIEFYTWANSTQAQLDNLSVMAYTHEVPDPTPTPISIDIPNGDFSDGTTDWTISNTSKMSVSSGALAVSSSSGEAELRQQLTNVPDGTYDLTATVTATIPSTSDAAYLFAKAKGHTMARTAIPLCTDEEIIVPGVTVDNGILDIGLYANGTQTITLDNFKLAESDSTRVQFLKGGEISKLTYLEEKGPITYKDADGNSKDCLQLMAEQGFNLARIRVLNNPGDNRGDGTYYLPEGYMDEADCLVLAKRAKEKGMQIEFTFAYSDYWSDGATQMVPTDWTSGASGLSGSSLATYYADKIYEYTKQVLQDLKAQDTEPEYISIGNEMQYGMCFGQYASNNGLYNNATYIAQLANAGAKAVREECPDAKIILHTDNGGKVTARTNFVAALSSIDFDVIGVSFYPYYNSDVSIDTVVSEFATLINKYDKDVIIMETGYNWNATRGDGYEGQLQDNGYYQSSYGESQQGQKAFLTELYAKLKKVLGGRCIGDMYWDPIMAYDNSSWGSTGYNTGWAIRESDNCTEANVVSNSDLFDFTDKALPAFDAMKYNTDANDKVLVSGTISSTTTGNKGQTTTTPVTNTAVTLTVNGAEYATTTDAYGQYIVAIDYPATEKVSVSASGYSGSYYVDAPAEGVLLSDIDFPSSTSVTAPAYNDDMAVIKTYTTEQGYIGNATSLTFSITPNDGVSGMFVTDDAGHKVEYDFSDDGDLPVLSGENNVLFGIVYPAIVDNTKFTVTVY
ncbi:MAG: glycosyl hydrolase 53 family protein [Candidatus Ornithomonoglobus sp.]